MTHDAFIFDSYAFHEASGTLTLRYSLQGGATFEETLVFPPSARVLSEDERRALESCFRLLFLLAGVSYYKTRVPERLLCRAFPLNEAMAAFVSTVYLNGLGEFAYRNKINLDGRIQFVTDPAAPDDKPVALNLSRRFLVPVGGGKDSIVTLESLKQAGESPTLFAVGALSGAAEPIRATIEASGLPSLYVARSLDPHLMDANRAGAFNGHVPITAIISAIALACAVLHGFSDVVMSNEHSASAPNLRLGNFDVNHQYSKSFAFEKELSQFVRAHIAADLGYFSFLRPWPETAIARRFARLDNYHSVFRSCNTAFRQDAARRGKTWCCDCPKCRFVFLALAPFMNKEKLIAVFGKNLLDDKTQTDGFAALCGFGAHKPFDCVGEVEESALLMEKLSGDAVWQSDAVVGALKDQFSRGAGNIDERFNALLTPRSGHCVPDRFMEAFRARG